MQHNDPQFEISRLLANVLEGTITTEEAERLNSWRRESAANEQLYQRLTNADYLAAQMEQWEKAPAAERRPVRFWRYAAAVTLLMAVAGGGVYLYLYQRGQLSTGAAGVAAPLPDTAFIPKGNIAKLIVQHGKELTLQGGVPQEFEEEDGTRVRNSQQGLYYKALGTIGKMPVYHTLVTPRGGEYSVVLADGTKAWLNAASSLRFPSHFDGRERMVELKGEAYFEVAKDAGHPFLVKTSRSRILVLGTAFNVNAYTDASDERTTLVSGAVRVSHGQQGAGVVLQPGLQAMVKASGKVSKVTGADMEEVLAWKNGLFVFNGASLAEILRHLSRWYDVDIKCESGLEQKFHFSARIHRYENIAGVLELLEMTGKVKFKLEKRILIVTPAKTI